MKKEHDKDTELLIDLIEGALQEEGYEVLRYSDSKKHYTTAYNALSIKRHDEVYFKITVDKCTTFTSPITNNIYKDGDTFESLKAEKALEAANERD